MRAAAAAATKVCPPHPEIYHRDGQTSPRATAGAGRSVRFRRTATGPARTAARPTAGPNKTSGKKDRPSPTARPPRPRSIPAIPRCSHRHGQPCHGQQQAREGLFVSAPTKAGAIRGEGPDHRTQTLGSRPLITPSPNRDRPGPPTGIRGRPAHGCTVPTLRSAPHVGHNPRAVLAGTGAPTATGGKTASRTRGRSSRTSPSRG